MPDARPTLQARRSYRDPTPSAIESLVGALAGTPRLDGALCKGRSDEWDADRDDDPNVATAKAACRRCPAFDRCRAWVDGLPPDRRPGGVVAGYAPEYRPPAGDEPLSEALTVRQLLQLRRRSNR